jgi:hypothetical protein
MMTDPICSRRPGASLRRDRAIHGFSVWDGTWSRIEGPHARVFDVPASRSFDRGLRLSLTLRCTATPDVVQ